MKKRILGNTGIELSEIGYGATALFGKNVFGKQAISEEEALILISTAVKNGITSLIQALTMDMQKND